MRVLHIVIHSAQKFGFDATLSQQIFYMAQAQRKAKMEPNRMDAFIGASQ